MAFVVISIGGEEISRHRLAGPTVMGRSVDADISVRDASMSRWHCRFEPPTHPVPHAAESADAGGEHEPGWVVVDLGSRNGTTVNGRKVTARQVLHHGDLLRIGRVTVFFSSDEFVPAGEPRDKPGRRRAAEPAGGGNAEKGFARPLLVPKTRLPRPDPGRGSPARRTTTSDLEMMSSPGWSKQLNGRKAPSPSVDHLPGEAETQKTIDLNEVVNGKRGQNAGMWSKVTRAVRRWLGR